MLPFASPAVARSVTLAGAPYVAASGGSVNVTNGDVLPAGPHAATARPTFRRPPVIVRPASAGIGSTVFSNRFLTAAVLAVQRESTSAAAPDTWGVAIDVPLKYAYVAPGIVESTCTPGAPRWTVAAP